MLCVFVERARREMCILRYVEKYSNEYREKTQRENTEKYRKRMPSKDRTRDKRVEGDRYIHIYIYIDIYILYTI